MLMLLQFPFADLRQLTMPQARPVVGPDWGLAPDPFEPDFLRGFGKLRTRSAYSVQSGRVWPSEGWFAKASSGIRLPELRAENFFSAGIEMMPKHAVRRVFSDGKVLWRVEIGVKLATEQALDAAQVAATVNDLLQLPVRIRRRGKWSDAAPLIDQGQALELALTEATTSLRSPANSGTDVSLRRGRPIVLVEASKPDLGSRLKPISAPQGALHIQVDGDAEDSPVDIDVATLRTKDHELPLVWVRSSLHRPPAKANAIRVSLLRLHAEREALTLVLRALHKGRLGEVGPELERYLSAAEARLFASRRNGVDQDLLAPVFSAYDSFTAVELAALEVRLADQRQTRLRALRLASIFTGPDGRTEIVVNEGGKVEMNTFNVDARGNSGQVNVGGTFVNNGTIISSMGDPKVQEATQAVNKLAEQLAAKLGDPADKESVANKTEAFVREAAAKKPDRDILKVTGKGLVEAAKAVAEMAAPIASAVTAVLGLFGLAL